MAKNSKEWDFLEDLDGIDLLPKRFFKSKHIGDIDFLEQELNKAIVIIEGYPKCKKQDHKFALDSSRSTIICSRCKQSFSWIQTLNTKNQEQWDNHANKNLAETLDKIFQIFEKIGESTSLRWYNEISSIIIKGNTNIDPLLLGKIALDWLKHPLSYPEVIAQLIILADVYNRILHDCIKMNRHSPTIDSEQRHIICKKCNSELVNITPEIRQQWEQGFSLHAASEAWEIIFHCIEALEERNKKIPTDLKYRLLQIYRNVNANNLPKISPAALVEQDALIDRIDKQPDCSFSPQIINLKEKLSQLSQANKAILDIWIIYDILSKLLKNIPTHPITPEKAKDIIEKAKEELLEQISNLDRERRQLELLMLD